MKKTRLVNVPVSDGDWEFAFEVTEEQAFALLNARIGETVKLNGASEQIYVLDKDCLTHTMEAYSPSHGVGSTSEGIQREATISTLNKMVANRVWDRDEDA